MRIPKVTIRALFAPRSALLAPRSSILSNRPARIGVREAWLAHEQYAGRRITTTGTIGVFEAGMPGEYFVLDDGPHRIGLRGEPALIPIFRAHLGRRVRATGTLTFRPGVGIFLDAEGVERGA